MDFKGLYSEEEIAVMQGDIEVIETRKKAQEIKLQGDILFAKNQLTEALEKYMESLETDPSNEYAHSNIGVIYLKRQDYTNCLKFTSRALELIESFQSDTREF